MARRQICREARADERIRDMRRRRPSKAFVKKQTRIISLLFFVVVFYIWTNIPKISEPPQAKSCYATLGEMKVHYLDYGEGKDAIVFIHGWACNDSFWRFQVPALQKKRLIIPDLPGHGKSDNPEIAYTLDLLAAGVNAVINDAGIESAILVGHSMGFPVARQYIRNYPGKTKALVIVEGAFFRVPKEQQKLDKWKKQFKQFSDKFKGPDSKKATLEFMNSLFAEQTSSEIRAEITSKVSLTSSHVAISALEGMGNPQIWKEDIFTMPVLAVYAKRPSLPPDNGQYLKQLFPNLKYHEWNGVGHFPMMEKPIKFNKLLTAFINSQ